MTIFYYGMRLRPAAPGAQPERLHQIEDDPTGKYWNIISYTRELSPEEVKNYDLDYLRKEETDK